MAWRLFEWRYKNVDLHWRGRHRCQYSRYQTSGAMANLSASDFCNPIATDWPRGKKHQKACSCSCICEVKDNFAKGHVKSIIVWPGRVAIMKFCDRGQLFLPLLSVRYSNSITTALPLSLSSSTSKQATSGSKLPLNFIHIFVCDLSYVIMHATVPDTEARISFLTSFLDPKNPEYENCHEAISKWQSNLIRWDLMVSQRFRLLMEKKLVLWKKPFSTRNQYG